jgi:hypothetical protein
MEAEGKDYLVKESNYDGSSKGMEAHSLSEFLDWAESVDILKLIKFACCDKDSSTHKIIR